jgi:hypothetical protein
MQLGYLADDVQSGAEEAMAWLLLRRPPLLWKLNSLPTADAHLSDAPAVLLSLHGLAWAEEGSGAGVLSLQRVISSSLEALGKLLPRAPEDEAPPLVRHDRLWFEGEARLCLGDSRKAAGFAKLAGARGRC